MFIDLTIKGASWAWRLPAPIFAKPQNGLGRVCACVWWVCLCELGVCVYVCVCVRVCVCACV